MKKLLMALVSLCLILGSLCLIPTASAESVLKGKTVLFCGDSICYGAKDDAADNLKGWAGRIGKKNNMYYVNAGLSGASVSNIRGENRILNQLIRNSDEDFRLVILHGGVNDAWDVAPVGTLKPAGETRGFDVSTFAGGLEQTLSYAKKPLKMLKSVI